MARGDWIWPGSMGGLDPKRARVQLWLLQGFGVTQPLGRETVRVCMPGSKNAGSMMYYLANENRRRWLRIV
jgi:hypothetical protein